MAFNKKSTLLKAALFATGFSGVVAEYVLATLATYFLGNSIVQWAIVISLMLFCMGLGSRITRSIKTNVFSWLIGVEFSLSVIVSFSALMTYVFAAYSGYTGVLIYSIAGLTGLMIGMELPLAIRLNDEFEELEVNVSNILEKDYYGSLLGGVFFVFVGLPFLGITYTPIVLGLVNLLVGLALLNVYSDFVPKVKRFWNGVSVVLVVAISASFFFAKDIVFFGEQKNYQDKIVFEEQTKYQKIIMTQWKNDHWLYLNQNLQFSTYDEPLYHEPLVHPAMSLHPHPTKVGVLGGGDGCAVREILKHPSVESITLVDLDPRMTELALSHEILLAVNDSTFHDEKVGLINDDAYHFMDTTRQMFDVLIIDLPDPRSVELSRLYSFEFYILCKRQLRPGGVIVTQSGSPYFAPKSFECIDKTMQVAGFNTLQIHNNIVTMGEWGWTIGWTGSKTVEEAMMKIESFPYERLENRWLNQSASRQITSFGKNLFYEERDSVEVNRIHNPVLYRYYLNGKWDLY